MMILARKIDTRALPPAGKDMSAVRGCRGIRGLVLLLLLAAAACSAPYTDVVKRLDAAPSCCTSMAAFPYRVLAFGQRMPVELTASSPAFLFSSGKSYFAAFALPRYPGRYRITIDSYPLGKSFSSAAIFLPIVVTLDEQHDVARSFDEDLFHLQAKGMNNEDGAAFKLKGTIEFQGENRDERYLVIMTRGDLMRSQILVTPPGGTEKELIRIVPVGRLLIRLERIAQ